MAQITYYVVQPFCLDEDGDSLTGEAVEARNGDHARRLASRLAEKGGAIAFSRTGDPSTGDFQDAVVLGRFGTVPEDFVEAATT